MPGKDDRARGRENGRDKLQSRERRVNIWLYELVGQGLREYHNQSAQRQL